MAKTSNLVPLAIIAGGLALYAYGKRQDRAAGVGDLGRSFRKSFSRVAAPVLRVAKAAASPLVAQVVVAKKLADSTGVTKTITDAAKVAVAPVLTLPVVAAKRITKKLFKGQTQTAPAPSDATVVYQDENGNVISQARYEAILAQNACIAKGSGWNWNGSACVAAPSPQSPQSQPSQPSQPAQPDVNSMIQAYVQQQAAAQQAAQQAAQSSGGGGAAPSASDYYARPTSAPAASSMPSYAAAAEPAKGGANPLLAAAAFIAVPAVMLLTGGK